jgi:hypothetical protein
MVKDFHLLLNHIPLPTSDQAREDDQIEQESQRHTASVGEDVERVKCAPEKGTPEIL